MKLSKKQQKFIKDAYSRACSEWKQEIKDNFPKLIEEPKLKVGRWYKKGYRLAYITELKKSDFFAYGFGNKNEWYDNDDLWALSHNGWELATDKEVEEALIKEAKRRGYKDGNYKCLLFPKSTEKLQDFYYAYNENSNILAVFEKDNHIVNIVFDNGKWAEIIEETKELTIEEIQEKLGYKIKIVE